MPLGTHPTGTTTPTSPPTTDSGVCAISPSDLVGYVGNLINRVIELEQRLAALEAGNIEVNQLSDLSQQVGWVDGITYMGIPGWTQTEYGTLIPPAGFTLLGSGVTMSDGNQYQAVVYDENGVLQFGFGQTQPDGTFTAVTGLQAGGGAFALIYSDTIRAQDVGNDGGIVEGLSTGFDPSNLVTVNDDVFEVTKSGWYRLSLTCGINAWGTDTNAQVNLSWGISDQGTYYDPNRASGPNIKERIGDTGGVSGSSGITNTSSSKLMWIGAGNNMSITWSCIGSTTNFIVGAAVITFQLLSEAATP